MMEEEKMYPVRILVGEAFCKIKQFQIFEQTTVYWRGDSEREIIFSRLGRILSSIKFPSPVEVVLGIGNNGLLVTLEKVRGHRISFNDGRDHYVYYPSLRVKTLAFRRLF